MKSMSFAWRATLLLPAALVFGCDQPPTAADQVAAPRAPARAGATASFVTRAGTQLLLDGLPYRFTGFNIYNANSNNNCWYTMASGPALDDALTAIGPGKAVFRSWFFQFMATTDGQRDWSAFDHTLAVARAHGVRVIATLGNQWADCEPLAGYKDETWYTTRYMEPDPGGTASYRDWVAEVVIRYRDDPTIFAWQLINEAEVKPVKDGECSLGAAGILKTWATDVAGVIKSLDPNHLVSLGTIGNGQCGAQGDEYRDVHSVATIDLCEFHDYQAQAPMPGDQWNGLQVRIDQCNQLGKPLFVGETGIIPNDVGGTLADRAAAFAAKFRVQFPAGIVGELVWAWSNLGSTLNTFDVGPNDPLLDVLGGLGVPARLAFTVPPGNPTAGQRITPAVQVSVVDAFGLPVTSYSGTASIAFGTNSTGARLSGTTTVPLSAGTATFSTLAISRNGAYTLRATSGTLEGTSPEFIVGPAPAKLVFTGQPTTHRAGAAISPAIQVTIQDAAGRKVAWFGGNVTLTIANNPGGGTLSGVTTQPAKSGVASFLGLSIDKAGTRYTLRATSGTLTPGISKTFDINPGQAVQLAFIVQPHDTGVGELIAPPVKVAVEDALGNVVTTFSGRISLRLGTNTFGGILTGGSPVPTPSGLATFPGLRIDKPGMGYTLQAVSGTRFPPATSTAFDIIGPATRLAFTAQPSTTTAGAIMAAVRVTALDAVGNTASRFEGDISVSIGVNPSGGVLSGTSPVRAQAGVAEFNDLHIDKAGPGYTLEAATPLRPHAISQAFDITAPGNQVQAVTAGWFHTCALKSDGTVACWGANDYAGGGGPFLGQATPPAPPSGTTFMQVSAGGYHTCALVSDGTVGCWGDNSNGEAPASKTPPVGTTFTQVSAGTGHTCALVSDGSIGCWGLDNYQEAPASLAPPAGTTFTRVSAGGYHTCALLSSAAVVCWGRDDLGQVTATPTATTFTGVDGGAFHNCALLNDATVTCWGANNLNQSTPPAGTSFTQVSAGGFNTCGLRPDGGIGCWGNGPAGTPLAGTAFSEVSVGYYHACALQSDGTVACWGDNTYGQASPPVGFAPLSRR